MRGVKYILALVLAVAGASALARNGGYENHYTTTVAGYAGYGNEGIVLAMPTTAEARTMEFAQCKALKSLDLSQVGDIGDAAFAYSAVTSIVLTADISSVGFISFGGCTNLEWVAAKSWNWADGTQNLADKEPFRDCTILTNLYVSGAAAEPPSFDVTVVFPAVETVYCPAANVEFWEEAYPTLEIVGTSDPGLMTLSVMNGFSTPIVAADFNEACEIAAAMDVQLTEEDIAAGLDAKYLCIVVTELPQATKSFAAPASQAADAGYIAVVAVNPKTVPAPEVGSSDSAAMTVSQNGDGVLVGISINNAIQGLWYGCEVKESLSDSAFVNDLDSFCRAPESGSLVIPCAKRTSEAAFYRVKVVATKPTE